MSSDSSRKPIRPLLQWYGEPLDRYYAEQLLQRAEVRQARRLRFGRSCITCRLQRLIGRFWLGQPIEGDFQVLRQLARGTAHGRALTELVHGQLLMSRRLAGAREHLEAGFSAARTLLAPADYFEVLRRHRQLEALPLQPEPGLPAEPLSRLLGAAAVADRLTGKTRPARPHDPNDTYG